MPIFIIKNVFLTFENIMKNFFFIEEKLFSFFFIAITYYVKMTSIRRSENWKITAVITVLYSFENRVFHLQNSFLFQTLRNSTSSSIIGLLDAGKDLSEFECCIYMFTPIHSENCYRNNNRVYIALKGKKGQLNRKKITYNEMNNEGRIWKKKKLSNLFWYTLGLLACMFIYYVG